MKLFAKPLSAVSACVEVGHMPRTCSHFDSMKAIEAFASSGCNACALNNNANTNTRINGWAGV